MQKNNNILHTNFFFPFERHRPNLIRKRDLHRRRALVVVVIILYELYLILCVCLHNIIHSFVFGPKHDDDSAAAAPRAVL